ncbi:MAG TPA: TerC/Alx family metal homeostasis membrane protein, partial [Burkholderiaceae bacterium]|nr:TerC/Alx family metal homeostasis membrane protein [Burkholderiaceae bacterium]
MTAGPFEWAVFWATAGVVFLVDALLVGRDGREPTARQAALWSAIWIGVGVLFGLWLALRFGSNVGLTYWTAYALEKSLSVDNLFVFILVFEQTGIPPRLQRRALFWGVAGALIMRAVLIGVGVFLLERFHWLIYPFAGLLVFAAVRMLRGEEAPRKVAEATCALCSSWIGRFVPITPQLSGSKFLVREGGRRMATPLLVALVAIESADLVFAVDSIPAVFAVTTDPYLVYTSNVFALFGLRSLYFLLAHSVARMRFLRHGLAVMLLFVAAKMLLGHSVDIPPALSLAVIAAILTIAIVASRLFPEPAMARQSAPCAHTDQINDVSPNTAGCEECLKSGDTWVHLRMC